MGAKRAERQIVVDGDAAASASTRCVDFETYPDWQAAVKDCEVQSRDGDGRGQRVAFEIDAKVKTVSVHARLQLRGAAPADLAVTWRAT